MSDTSNTSLHLHTMVSSLRLSYSICIHHAKIIVYSTQVVSCRRVHFHVFISLHTYSCIPYRWNDTSGVGMLPALVVHTGIFLAVPISADHPFHASDTQGSLRRESLIPFCLLTCRSEAHLLCLMCVNKHPLYH